MNKLVAFYNSSIGKKVTMSLTGLFLCTFLVEHLIGNLLLFRNDGGRMYQAYTEFLVGNVVIRTIEIVLFASLVGHALSGVSVWFLNKRSRPQKYEVYRLKDNTPLASRITMLTGSIVFLFLVIHLRTFFIGSRFAAEEPNMYEMIRTAFASPTYSIFYVVALAFLAYHLKHGFQSAFQTLGLNNKKYTWLINAVAVIFWLLIPIGFASLPVYFLWFK
ncbi:MAG: succinate dehydrogenase cytochrome b subunit [Ignavibacteriales bacterium]|nr:succinate dehydrogenase cytochrome b subunit [Ignavibacteriales bacterium]